MQWHVVVLQCCCGECAIHALPFLAAEAAKHVARFAACLAHAVLGFLRDFSSADFQAPPPRTSLTSLLSATNPKAFLARVTYRGHLP